MLTDRRPHCAVRHRPIRFNALVRFVFGTNTFFAALSETVSERCPVIHVFPPHAPAINGRRIRSLIVKTDIEDRNRKTTMPLDLKSFVMTIEAYFFYFVVITLPLFAAVSVANRLGVKGVRMVVRNGILWGFPLLPTVYACVQVACILIGYAIGDAESITKFSVYFLASLFWFVGSAVAEERLVLNEGILLSVNSRKKSLLPWNAITDYFSRVKPHYTEYAFFIHTAPTAAANSASGASHAKAEPASAAQRTTRSKIILRVQHREREQFERLLRQHLDSRFEVDPAKIFRSEFKSDSE